MSLLEKGHQVAATMRNPLGKNKKIATELKDAGAIIIEMDVTDTESVNSGVQQAIDALGGLDVVVNNAGRGVSGMQEHFTPEDFQQILDVNVIGVQRVNRAALPFLRKQGRGLLIHISSLLGRIALPFYGPYQSAKWAVEAMAENYRVELSGFGVQSTIIEPGGYPTSFMTNLMTPSDSNRNESYGDFMDVPAMAAAGFEEQLKNTPEQNPQKVADAVAHLIETPAKERPFRTTLWILWVGEMEFKTTMTSLNS
ncbi:SDR family oxidoreductase [Fulvivirga sp. 29W222]|uniref:SDR family oxidoreductase n=1 Tax=Fulvivirga marina TaxID=2494733 RepID=A0A937G1B2_9BACT|nr:SDR family oxidoreductase [Fulvivirga marina]